MWKDINTGIQAMKKQILYLLSNTCSRTSFFRFSTVMQTFLNGLWIEFSLRVKWLFKMQIHISFIMVPSRNGVTRVPRGPIILSLQTNSLSGSSHSHDPGTWLFTLQRHPALKIRAIQLNSEKKIRPFILINVGFYTKLILNLPLRAQLMEIQHF